MEIRKKIIGLCVCVLIVFSMQAQKVVFVDKNATGTNDGSSWKNAFTQLQPAINKSASNGGGQVWVAQGTYVPSLDSTGKAPSDIRNACFVLTNKVSVYGGFVGTENTLEMRNYNRNQVILSGELQNNTSLTDNAYHVVYSKVISDTTAQLDGVTITKGYSDTRHGAGVYLQGALLRNCIVYANESKAKGGGVYAVRGYIEKCELKYNSAQHGGAVYAHQSTILTSKIHRNTATDNGAGVYAVQSELQQNTLFYNHANVYGGAVYMVQTSVDAQKIYCNKALNGAGLYCVNNSHVQNSLIINNTASSSGGGVYVLSTQNTFINNTISCNIALTGGGLFAMEQAVVGNTVFWNNSEDVEAQTIVVSYSFISDNSYITNGTDSVWVINTEKGLFIKAPDTLGYAVTPQGLENVEKANWEPIAGSQLCDRGTNILAAGFTGDCLGNNRFNRNSSKQGEPLIDIGAYEAKSALLLNAKRIVYMKPRWTGKGDGSSWENATSDLQMVLQALSSMYFPQPPQIWMQQGIYYPKSASLAFGFQIKSKVYMYGGFLGTETSIDDRNLAVYNSQLSGEFGVFGDNNDNIDNVLYVSNESIVDGFSITGAKKTGLQLFNYSTVKNCEILYNGVDDESPGVKMYDSFMENCKVHHNVSAKSSYGGVYAYNSSLKDSYIYDNTSMYYAGGIYAYNSVIDNCYIYNNSVTNIMFAIAGGIYATGNTIIKNSSIYNNTSTVHTGGVFLENSLLSKSSVYNNSSDNICGGVSSNGFGIVEACNVYNNRALQGGGLYNIKHIENSVIANNTATKGAAVYNFSQISYSTIVNNASQTYGSIYSNSGTIMASIIWGNTSANWQYPIFFQTSGEVLYSAVQGGWSGNGTFMLDHRNTDAYGPHFVEPTSVSGITSQQGDWRIQASSVLIDKSIFTQDIPSTDIVGTCRVIGQNPDIGAYEQGVNSYDTLQLQRIYVTTNGEGDGSSWSKSMNNIHKALFLADYLHIPEVWVAQGTYLTSEVRDRSVNFTLRSGISLYGGFKGGEQFLQERVPGAYPSILSGDIGRFNREYDDAYRVVYFAPKVLADTAVIDGFEIRNSYNVNEPQNPYCAVDVTQAKISNCVFTNNTGIALKAKGAIVTNCSFYENQASQYGAAVHIENSKFLDNTVFQNAGKQGGGIYAKNSKITDCIIHSNTSENGGGVYAEKSEIRKTTIYNNVAKNNGGGLYLYAMPSYSINNVIYNNTAENFGGGVYADSVTAIYFTTVTSNKALQQGGGLYGKGSQSAELRNSLFWNNISPLDSSISLLNNAFRNTLKNNAFSSDCPVTYAKNTVYLHTSNMLYDSVAPFPRFIHPSGFVGATSDSTKASMLQYCIWEMQHFSSCIDVAEAIPMVVTDYYDRLRIIKGIEDKNAPSLPDIGAIETKSFEIKPQKGIVYISPQWKGLGDGSSWEHARNTFPDVLAKASTDTLQVWVSQGVYKPTADSTENSADTLNKRLFCFTMKNNATVIGGFKGTETSVIERNPIEYKTILSGFPPVYEDRQNSYHVLYSQLGTDTTAVFDGFYIIGGNADDFAERSLQKGGGAYVHGGSVVRCFIAGNTAYREAGGVYMKQGARLINSVVANNYSFTSVGGVSAYDTTVVDASTIVRNTASKMYGGVFSQPDARISNSVLWGNNATTFLQSNRIDNFSYTAVQSDSVFSNSNVYALHESNTVGDASFFAPQFVNPSAITEKILNQIQIMELLNANWSIQQQSYLKNKAQPSFIPLCGDVLDIRNMQRRVGDTADVGAFEYNGIPKILNTIADENLCVHETATYTIQAEGANLQYRWEYIDGVVWKPLNTNEMFSGVTSPELHIFAAYYLENTIDVRCKVYNQDGSVYSNVGYIAIKSLPKAITKKHYTICDGELIILPVEEQTTVTWEDGRVSISIQPRVQDWYTYTLQNQYECSVTDSIQVTIGILPKQPFALDTMLLCSGTYVWLQTDNSYLSYVWSDNSKNSTIQVHQDGVYGVTVKDFNGCSLYDSVTVRITEAILPMLQAVSYAKDGSGVVIQTNTHSQALHSQEIHRAISTNYAYSLVGTLDLNTTWLKDVSVNEHKNYSYAIKALDSCMFASSFSSIHTPLFVDAYRRITNPNIVDLFWSEYKGLPKAAEYSIYRGKTKETMEFVATIPSTQTYYSLSVDGYEYYRISMAMPQSFTIQSQEYAHTYSNISRIKDWTALQSNTLNEYSMYPNPCNHENVQLMLPYASANRIVYVFDLQGRVVFQSQIQAWEKHYEIPTMQLPQGIYMCMITEGQRVVFADKIICLP